MPAEGVNEVKKMIQAKSRDSVISQAEFLSCWALCLSPGMIDDAVTFGSVARPGALFQVFKPHFPV